MFYQQRYYFSPCSCCYERLICVFVHSDLPLSLCSAFFLSLSLTKPVSLSFCLTLSLSNQFLSIYLSIYLSCSPSVYTSLFVSNRLSIRFNCALYHNPNFYPRALTLIFAILNYGPCQLLVNQNKRFCEANFQSFLDE